MSSGEDKQGGGGGLVVVVEEEEEAESCNKKSCRKRARDLQLGRLKKSYYDRLIYTCDKDLRKNIKQTKTLLCQKMIRKIKEGMKEKEQQLQEMKNCRNFDCILQECFRRLGILQLNPVYEKRHQNPFSNVQKHENCEASEGSSLNHRPAWITDKVLSHKKMQDAVEKWNDHVTAYRRWCLHLQDGADNVSSPKNSTSKKKKPHNGESSKISMHDYSNSLFVQLGGDNDNDDKLGLNDHNKLSPYGPQSGSNIRPQNHGDFVLKKNRPGQRARKAKAMAIKAKEQGKKLDQSFNWRPKTNHKSEKNTNTDIQKKNNLHSFGRNMPDISYTDTSLHPSWQARKAKPSGIVEFQGSKITFD